MSFGATEKPSVLVASSSDLITFNASLSSVVSRQLVGYSKREVFSVL